MSFLTDGGISPRKPFTIRRIIISFLAIMAVGLPSTPAYANSGVASQQLDEVVVSATKTPRRLGQVGSAVTVVDRKQIERMQAGEVSEVLRTVPSTNVTKEGGGPGQRTEVRLRGSESNHTLILLDGIELNSGDRGIYDLSNVPTEIIERIEIVRGAQSVLYGSESIGGVINIVTREGSRKSRTGLTVEGGSFSTFRGAISRSGTTDNLKYNLVYQREESDGFSQGDEDLSSFDEDDGHEQDHLYTTIESELIENLTMDASARFTEATVESDDVSIAMTDSQDFSRDLERNAKLQFQYESAEKQWRHTLKGTYTNVDNFFNNRRFGVNEKQKIQYQTDFRANENYLVSAGVSLEEDELIDENITRDDDAYFVQLQAEYERGSLTAGIRRDDFEASGIDATPDETTSRITGAVYPMDDFDLKVRGSWGEAIVRPTSGELNGFPAFGIPGNPDLEAEESTSWDLGLQKSFFDREGLLRLTYFENEIDNRIEFPTFMMAFNSRRLEVDGWEVELDWSPTRRLSAAVALTLQDLRQVNRDGSVVEPARRPEEFGSLDLNYRWSPQFHTNLVVTYEGESIASGQSVDDYTVADLAGEYELKEDLTLTGRVDNLFDEEYQEIPKFGTAERSAFFGARATF